MLISDSNSKKQDLKTNVVYSGVWLYFRLIVTSLINIGVMAILARQLRPAEFGIVALANVLLRFLMIIGAEGVSEYVIYDNKKGKEERVYSAFWMDISFSVFAILISLPFIPLIVSFYNEPILKPVLFALLLKFFLDTLSKVPDALIKKKMDFQKLAVRDTILEIFVSIFSVILALNHFGVWSLIIPGLIASPMRAFIVFWMAHWVPKFKLYLKHWKQIFSYSANVIGGTLTSYTLSEGDTLLIGKFLGSESLGFYNLAYQSANIVPRNVTVIANKLSFPALSSINNNLAKLSEITHRILRFISYITFPLLIGLFVLADDFVLTVYGPQWEKSILPLRIMIIFALRYSVGSIGSSLWKAIGRTDISFKLGAFTIPFYLLSIWIGSYFGIVGVALAVTFVRTIFGLIGFELMGKCLNQNFIKIIRTLSPAFVASCLMGIFVFFVNLLINPLIGNSKILILASSVFAGGLFFLVLLRTIYTDFSKEVVVISDPILGKGNIILKKILNVK